MRRVKSAQGAGKQISGELVALDVGRTKKCINSVCDLDSENEVEVQMPRNTQNLNVRCSEIGSQITLRHVSRKIEFDPEI